MHTHILKAGLKEAQKAAEKDEVPVGAVLFSSETEKIIAKAHNLVRQKKDPTAHAEMLVLKKGCQKIGTDKLIGYSLFVTLEPCAMCAGAISLARLDALYFGAFDKKTGAIQVGAKIFQHSQTHHKPKVYAPIEEKICGQILSDFFKQKRAKKNG